MCLKKTIKKKINGRITDNVSITYPDKRQEVHLSDNVFNDRIRTCSPVAKTTAWTIYDAIVISMIALEKEK
jgi:hypothetical protein